MEWHPGMAVIHMQAGQDHEDEEGVVVRGGRLSVVIVLDDGTLVTVRPLDLRQNDDG